MGRREPHSRARQVDQVDQPGHRRVIRRACGIRSPRMTPDEVLALARAGETFTVEFKGEEADRLNDEDLVLAAACLANGDGGRFSSVSRTTAGSPVPVPVTRPGSRTSTGSVPSSPTGRNRHLAAASSSSMSARSLCSSSRSQTRTSRSGIRTGATSGGHFASTGGLSAWPSSPMRCWPARSTEEPETSPRST